MQPKSNDEYLTNFVEKVLVDDVPFELRDEHDQIVFMSLNAKSGKSPCHIRIKKSEILFAQKSTEPSGLYPSNPFASCSAFGRLNPFVRRIDNKELWRLADLREKFDNWQLGQNARINNTNQENKRFETVKNAGEIYLLARAKNFRWRVASLTCNFVNDAACDRWLTILNGRIKDLSRPKNLLVFVNPFGGKGLALRCYKDYVEPLFKLCNIDHRLITTERANHAKDVVMNDDLTPYDGIVSVGGDGLFNEILNGILIRAQNDNAVDLDNSSAQLYRARLQLAAVPAGSMNAFAHTLNGTADSLTAVLHIILGDRRLVDVCSIHRGSKFDRFACIAASYGFLGDVLRQSERLRWLGPPRYLFAGVKMAIKYPVYKGRIELKLSKTIPHSPNVVQSALPVSLCHADCTICGSASRRDIKDLSAVDRSALMESRAYSKEEPIDSPETLVLENVSFLHLIGVITPALCKLSPRGLSPTCHLGDGVMHVAIVEPISRLKNACFISKVMHKREHDHLAKRFVKLYGVTGFSFLPSAQPELNSDRRRVSSESRASDSESKSRNAGNSENTWNIDGELLNQSNDHIKFRMHKQLINIFARGIELNQTDVNIRC